MLASRRQVVACSVAYEVTKKREGTELHDSAGLEGTGHEYRSKAHWELEAKLEQVFYEAYKGDKKQSF